MHHCKSEGIYLGTNHLKQRLGNANYSHNPLSTWSTEEVLPRLVRSVDEGRYGVTYDGQNAHNAPESGSIAQAIAT